MKANLKHALVRIFLFFYQTPNWPQRCLLPVPEIVSLFCTNSEEFCGSVTTLCGANMQYAKILLLTIYLSIRFITSLFMDLKKKKPLTRQRSGVQILPTHPSHNSMHHNQSRIVSFAWRRHRACEKVLRVQSICPMDSSVCERL